MGVVSIITGITIFVSGQHAQAAEMTQSSSDFNEQSQQTEQVEHKEDTTHLSYELNQEGDTASQSKTNQENQSDGNVQKKSNQIQQDSTQTSPLNDQKQTSMEQQSKDNHVTPNSRQDTYPKGQIKMIKANNSLKIINTHKQDINLILKIKIMIKIHQIKSNTHLIKLKTHLQKEHNLNNHSL